MRFYEVLLSFGMFLVTVALGVGQAIALAYAQLPPVTATTVYVGLLAMESMVGFGVWAAVTNRRTRHRR